MAASVHPSTDTVRLDIDDHNPDIFTIICCNDSFQLALDHSTIKTLLRVCKRARPLLSSKLARFHTWCQSMELLNPDGQLRIGLTPSDQIAISMHCEDQETTDRYWLEDQADQGCSAAAYFLARILQVELAGQPKISWPERRKAQMEIFHLFKAAAEADHTMAKFHLADCYRNGLGADQDHTKAVELYRSLAERGMPQAQVVLGRCYESGEGVEQDYGIAIEWYSKVADQGSDSGRLHIVFLRGWFSFIGHGVEQSDVDAFNHWQEVSTNSTDSVIQPIATHMVGWMHYLGRGTERDEQQGVKIIRDNKSAEFKLGEAESQVGLYLDSTKSPVASHFFNLCQLGSEHDWLCKHLMAVCLFQGFGTAANGKKAADIFEQLANDGHSDSQLWIGGIYCSGRGVLIDQERAFEWLSKSAIQGNSYGQMMVGNCYYYGTGVTKDYTKAAEWYRKSADQCNRYGQNSLGDCHENGFGVPQDIDVAILWFRKSADQGLDSAIDRLKELAK